MKNKYTHIIWDFNGTLLSDMQAGIDCANEMLSERGLPAIESIEEYRSVFGFPIIDYYRRLGFDFDKEDYYTVLAPLWVSLYLKNSAESPLMQGAVEALRIIKERGISQLLLSATEINMLQKQVDHYGIREYFDEIMGLDNIHAGSKASLAVAWKKNNPNSYPLFIGDTEHDAQVAAGIGADCVLFSGGHQSADKLLSCGVPVVDRLEDVIGLAGIF